MKKYVVIVESPSKVGTIQNYLSNNYTVVASVGHIRQIKKQSGSVKFDNTIDTQSKTVKNKFNFIWEVDNKKLSKILSTIKESKPVEIILGTDPDREGEAIAWSISELLKENKISAHISRMRFHEITEKSINSAIETRCDLNYDLINAYLVRVGLDYEIGFKISAVLRNKIRCFNELSAGRVQTPTLVAIVNKERSRKGFIAQYSYSIKATLENENGIINAELIKYNDEQCDEILDKKIADSIVLDKLFSVTSIKSKKVTVSAPYPFITVSLQQECFNKLGFSLSKSMQIAQELFNKGFITYMRTDSYSISKEFLESIHNYIGQKYSEYKIKPRIFKNKVKNAQEAHECIRPTNLYTLQTDLGEDFDIVYKLIHNRTVACQMANAIREQTTVILKGQTCELKHNFSKIIFKGFKVLEEIEKNNDIININVEDQFNLKSYNVLEHKTEPSPRYSEATLVEMMKTAGIGRPSTYANIFKILLEREFITVVKKQILPTLKGEIVSSFMECWFDQYSNPQFTDKMEEILDTISKGEGDFNDVLLTYFEELEERSKEIISMTLGDVFKKMTQCFPQKSCSNCNNTMEIGMKFSPFYICKSCGKIEKFEDEKLNLEETHFEVVKNPKYTIIKYIGKNILLPKEFNHEIDIEVVRFLVSLPIKLCEYEGANIKLYLNKIGFTLGWNRKYHNTSFENIYKKNEEHIQEIVKNNIK